MYRTRRTKLFNQVGLIQRGVWQRRPSEGISSSSSTFREHEYSRRNESLILFRERGRENWNVKVPARNADHIRDSESCKTCASDRQPLTLLTSAKMFSCLGTRSSCLIRRYLILVLFYSSFYILPRLSIFPFVFPFCDHARSTKISSWYDRDIGHLFHRILNINEKFGIARQQHLIDLFTERITQRLARRVP